MARGNYDIKGEQFYESGSRKAMARFAKRVGMDLRKTATKIANDAGFTSFTQAVDAWRQDKKYETTLMRDFLMQKAAERGAQLPNYITQENLGQQDEKGKTNTVEFPSQYAAAENGKVVGTVRNYVDKDGEVVGTEVTSPQLDKGMRSIGANNLMEALFKYYDNSKTGNDLTPAQKAAAQYSQQSLEGFVSWLNKKGE